MTKLCVCINYSVILVLLLTIYSCSKQKGVRDVLVKAENIVEQQPDSALRLLNTILFSEDLNKSLFNKYNLLLLQAKDKSDKDITSDTVIFSVKDYYVRKKDYPNAALAAFYCGRVWHEQNNADKAFEAYKEAEKWADKTDNNNLKGLLRGNLGILYREHSSYERAIAVNKDAVEMYDKAKNYKNEISSLRTIGDCFLLNNKIDSAFYYYNESLKLTDSCNLPKLQSDVKESMGVAYREQGLFVQAKKLFNEAHVLSEDSVEQARIWLNIAKIYVIEDNIDSVNFYLDKALALQINKPWIIRSSYLLKSKIEEKNKKYLEALNDYKEYYHYTEKVFDSEKNNKLLELQEKYDYEKLKNSQNQVIIKHQKALIILSLVLLAASIIIIAYYRKSAQNKRLLLKSEQEVERLQKTADHLSKKSHNVLHKLAGILRKTALVEIDFSNTEQVSEKKLVKKFYKIVYEQDKWDWNILYLMMNDAQNGLYDKIRIKYPQLSELEFRICCLTCETDFKDKEIGIILGTTFQMVQRIRSDIRKKIGMAKGEGFLTFFKNSIQ